METKPLDEKIVYDALRLIISTLDAISQVAQGVGDYVNAGKVILARRQLEELLEDAESK